MKIILKRPIKGYSNFKHDIMTFVYRNDLMGCERDRKRHVWIRVYINYNTINDMILSFITFYILSKYYVKVSVLNVQWTPT